MNFRLFCYFPLALEIYEFTRTNFKKLGQKIDFIFYQNVPESTRICTSTEQSEFDPRKSFLVNQIFKARTFLESKPLPLNLQSLRAAKDQD